MTLTLPGGSASAILLCRGRRKRIRGPAAQLFLHVCERLVVQRATPLYSFRCLERLMSERCVVCGCRPWTNELDWRRPRHLCQRGMVLSGCLPGMSDNAEVSCVSASLCQITGSSVSGTTGTAVSYSNGDLGTAQSLPDVYSFRGASARRRGSAWSWEATSRIRRVASSACMAHGSSCRRDDGATRVTPRFLAADRPIATQFKEEISPCLRYWQWSIRHTTMVLSIRSKLMTTTP